MHLGRVLQNRWLPNLTRIPNPSDRTTRSLGTRYLSNVPNVASLLARTSAVSPDSTAVSEGHTVTVNGFIRTVRKQKKVAFASIGDGSTLEPLQAVLSPELAEGLSTGAAVTLTGNWKASPQGKEQSHELHALQVEVRGDNDAAAYPLQKKYHSSEFLRTIPHLRSRLPLNSLLLRLRSYTIAQLTAFFSENNFTQTHTPIITSNDCEGAGEAFMVSPASGPGANDNADDVPFFRSPKYLTVSAQLHLEALALSVGKVWTLSPTFRAEKSDTPRHLSEFYMLEAEQAFVDDMAEVMDVVESMLRHAAQRLSGSSIGSELLRARALQTSSGDADALSPADLQRRWEVLIQGPWSRVTYASAVTALQEAVKSGEVAFEFAPTHGEGLQAEHERFIAAKIGNDGPVFITDYPRDIKAFYMAPSSSTLNGGSQDTVACFDLVLPDVCEIVGGSMREHNLSNLIEAMKRHNMPLPEADPSETAREPDSATTTADDTSSNATRDTLKWYMDLRRYGSVSHGGFGLGFDRFLCYLSGVSNLREIVAFPRWYGRCDG